MSGVQYSQGAYVAIIKMRSTRTLLVEGSTDKKIVSRLVREIESRSGRPLGVVIDTAEIVASGPVPTGNREKVEQVHALCTGAYNKFAALVDREFRQFETTLLEDQFADHFVSAASLFWTRGHSLENYLFDLEWFVQYVRMRHSDAVDSAAEAAFRGAFPNVMRWMAAIGCAAKESGMITRMAGAITRADWVFSARHIQPDVPRIQAELTRRGTDPVDVAGFGANATSFFALLTSKSDEVVKWICHGHIGWEILWAAAAAVFLENGTDPRTAETVARGDTDSKLRFLADKWCSNFDDDARIDMPNAFVAWMSTP